MPHALSRGRPNPKAHEAIKVLDIRCRISGMSRRELAKRSGVPERTLADWWYAKSDPHLFLIESALAVFDLRLKVSGKEKS